MHLNSIKYRACWPLRRDVNIRKAFILLPVISVLAFTFAIIILLAFIIVGTQYSDIRSEALAHCQPYLHLSCIHTLRFMADLKLYNNLKAFTYHAVQVQ